MNLEFPNDNHHSYIIKDGSKRCKAGVAGLKLLITKERETGIEPATSSLGSWHSTAELLPLTLAVVAGGISNNTGAGTTVQQTFDTITAGRRDFNRARVTNWR